MAAHGSRHSAYRPRIELGSDKSQATLKHEKATKPPACAHPPHRWDVDARGVGTCAKCGQEYTFPNGYTATFRDAVRDSVQEREFYGVWVER